MDKQDLSQLLNHHELNKFLLWFLKVFTIYKDEILIRKHM